MNISELPHRGLWVNQGWIKEPKLGDLLVMVKCWLRLTTRSIYPRTPITALIPLTQSRVAKRNALKIYCNANSPITVRHCSVRRQHAHPAPVRCTDAQHWTPDFTVFGSEPEHHMMWAELLRALPITLSLDSSASPRSTATSFSERNAQ